MLSALRGILQRWVGMTTEVQTVEAGEAPAVRAAAAPTCSADFAANTTTRRLKRAGALTNEAADLKRPRTAPATPIDASANGGIQSVGKLTASDTDSRIGGPTDNCHLAASRSSAAASAPAALTRALRSQPSISTAPATTTPGSCSGSGTFATTATTSRHCGAISGVLTAFPPQQQQQLLQLQQRSSSEDVVTLSPPPADSHGNNHQQAQQQEQQPPTTAGPGLGASMPLQLLPALFRAAATGDGGFNGGGSCVSGSGSSPATTPGSGARGGHHHSPQHQHHHHHYPQLQQPEQQQQQQRVHANSHSHRDSHGSESPVQAVHPHPQPHPHNQHHHPQHQQQQQHPQDPHHRHDALEELVFSPAFHRHTPAPASPPSSAQASPAAAKPQSAAAAAAAARTPATVTEEAAAAGSGAGVAAPSTHPQGPPRPVGSALHAIDLVDGVVTGDTGQGEGENEQAVAVAVAAATALRGSSSSSGEARGQRQQQRHVAVGAETGAAAAAPVESGVHGEASGAEGDEEEDLLDECDDNENDENAPVGLPAMPMAAAAATTTVLQTQQQQQHLDAVLVASAPRGLAAAVSAVLPATAAAAAAAAQQQQQRTCEEEDGDTEQGSAEHEEEEDDDEDEDETLLEFDPLLFIKQLPPLETCVPPHRPVLLPLQTRAMARRKTLVLDLDETLVHSSLEAVDRSDFSFPVVFNGMEHQVYVRQRPHLRNFMLRVASLFEVVVFTASQRIYAERLLDILDPQQQLVRHRIYRDSCVVVDGNYLKDLSILGRDLAHTVIVDNSPQAFGFQVDNGIPIESWYDDDGDTELLRLLPFLESLAGAEVGDVRPRIRSQFRLRELIDRA